MARLSNDYVPKDYDDLYRYYFLGDGDRTGLVYGCIGKFCRTESSEEKQDLACQIFLRCMERNVLKLFDPMKSNFGGVIFFVSRSICVNYLAKKSRDPIAGLKAGTLVMTSSGNFEQGVYDLERMDDGVDPMAELDVGEHATYLITRLFEWAAERKEDPKVKRDSAFLPLLELMSEGRKVAECGKELGVTSSTIHNWLGIMKKRVTDIERETA